VAAFMFCDGAGLLAHPVAGVQAVVAMTAGASSQTSQLNPPGRIA
jgi:hypothetical protein